MYGTKQTIDSIFYLLFFEKDCLFFNKKFICTKSDDIFHILATEPFQFVLH